MINNNTFSLHLITSLAKGSLSPIRHFSLFGVFRVHFHFSLVIKLNIFSAAVHVLPGKMKTLSVALLVTCFICSTSAEHKTEELIAHGQKCGGTPEDVEILATYGVPHTPTGKCMAACLAKDYGALDEHGKYCKLHAKKYLETKWGEYESHAEAISNQCEEYLKHISTTNECEYGYEIVNCIRTKMNEHNYFTPYLEKAKEIYNKFKTGAVKITESIKLKLKDEFEKFKSIFH